MTKRIHYPINKEKIQEAIYWYNEYDKREPLLSYDEGTALWDKYNDAFNQICPQAHVWAANIFQPMKWSGTLDVEHVYNAILAMGINTKLEEVDNETEELVDQLP